MGVDTRRPPLPAPTETTTSLDQESNIGTDVATNVSRRTDCTSYLVPEDGSPITISTHKLRPEGGLLHARQKSQTSLLIEYFEGGKPGDKARRPSVRVKVTPSAGRKSKNGSDHVQITGVGKDRKPSYTRRISLGSKRVEDKPVEGTEVSQSSESNLSGHPPVEIEVLDQNGSDLSNSNVSRNLRYVQPTSDISSMPPDSMLDNHGQQEVPRRRRSRSVEREETTDAEHLKAPTRQRSRSLSKERIAHKVMEKIGSKPRESSGRHKHGHERSVSKDYDVHGVRTERRRRSSKSYREEDAVSGAESSLLTSQLSGKSGDQYSFRSTTSKSSINNPKLLETVEDAIRRLILPELATMKEEQKLEKNHREFEQGRRQFSNSATDDVRESLGRRISKSSSSPNMVSKPKVVLNREGDDPGTVLSRGDSERKKMRKSSREHVPLSEKTYAQRQREASFHRDRERLHKKSSKDSNRLGDAAAAAAAGGILTAAALNRHESRESIDRDKRKRRSKSRSRSASIAESTEEFYQKDDIPPMPMAIHLNDSELTRDSILSAETERPRSSRGSETPVREVPRWSMDNATPMSQTPNSRTPTRTPVALQQGSESRHNNRSTPDLDAVSPKSAQSISTKARVAALAAAGLGGATALAKMEHQHNNDDGLFSTSNNIHRIAQRDVSPIQSVASYKDDMNDPLIPQSYRPRSAASYTSAGHDAIRKHSGVSLQSAASSPSASLGRSRNRRQVSGLDIQSKTVEQETHPESELIYGAVTPGDESIEEFYEREHAENERYRHSMDGETQRDSTAMAYGRETTLTDNSTNSAAITPDQHVHGVGANPEYVHTPLAVESAVASLLDPSTLSSVQSSDDSRHRWGNNDFRDSTAESLREVPGVFHQDAAGDITPRKEESPSRDRWSALRGHAQAVSDKSLRGSQPTSSPRHSKAQSLRGKQSAESEHIQMGASGIPLAHDPMPEIGHGLDDESDVNTNPSIIHGPIGGPDHGSREHWPYDPTPPLSPQRHGLGVRDGTPENNQHGSGAAVPGVSGGLAAEHTHRHKTRSQRTASSHQLKSEDDYDGQELPKHHQAATYLDMNATPGSPPNFRDEGYITARSNENVTPKTVSKAAKGYTNEDLAEYNAVMGGDDPFANNALHARHLSGNSHGMGSPLYDSSIGKGIDRIQSKDVVALMDHLTVRDAQRNARDTEILVTLVRSAAEMRNSFEEMKRFISEQDKMIMNNTDRDADITVQKVLSGPRPQPLGSPRTPRRSYEEEDIPTKRKNVFKRALKGLSMKSSNDLSKIEDMLVQLLGDVETLKENQGVDHRYSTASYTTNQSLDSYERLRAAPDPGYEPEGRAGTSSTPNQSGHLSS
ncbi:hypothetical protein LTR66_009241, partial [Elasticomyces elasticus]